MELVQRAEQGGAANPPRAAKSCTLQDTFFNSLIFASADCVSHSLSLRKSTYGNSFPEPEWYNFNWTLVKTTTLGKIGCSFSFLNTLQEDPAIPQVSQLQLQRANVQFQKGFWMVRAILSAEKATYRISQTSGPNLSLLNPTILNILGTFDAWDNCNKCCMILKVCKCQQSS